jgi:hypothetical protein
MTNQSPMIGYLDARNSALLRLQARGLPGTWQVLVCEIDTGAEPMLLTSSSWIEHLGGLSDSEQGEVVTLADGQITDAAYAVIEVNGFGSPRLIDVLVPRDASTEPAFQPPGRRGRRPNALLGRGMLADCRLTIDYGRANVAIDRSQGAAA